MGWEAAEQKQRPNACEVKGAETCFDLNNRTERPRSINIQELLRPQILQISKKCKYGAWDFSYLSEIEFAAFTACFYLRASKSSADLN